MIPFITISFNLIIIIIIINKAMNQSKLIVKFFTTLNPRTPILAYNVYKHL